MDQSPSNEPRSLRLLAPLLVALLLCGAACTESILEAACGPGYPCPSGQVCADAGICVPATHKDGGGDDASPWPDLKLQPDLGCPSGVLCGKPSKCCKTGEECVEGRCLPACASGVRCIDGQKVTCCNAGTVCLNQRCTVPGRPCKDSFDCNVGFFCEVTLGRCLPSPTGVKCEVRPSSVSFSPTVEWSWSGYSKDSSFHEVAVSPTVADLDADGTPEVIATVYSHSSSSKAMLVVLDGKTGKEELTVPYTSQNISAWCNVAVGNLDADKQLEMVTVVAGKGVTAFEHDGTVKWTAGGGTLARAASRSFHPQIALADLDADGKPEVIAGGVVLDAAGKVLFDKGIIGANSSWTAPTAAGAVPAKEERNWDKKGLNNFRQNDQGEGVFNAADLVVVGMEAYTLGCPQVIEVRARVSNKGSLGAVAGIPVSVYRGTPGTSSQYLGTVTTKKNLLPGQSELITVNFKPPQGNYGPFDFWAAVDNDNKGGNKVRECNEKNNTGTVTDVVCTIIK